MTRVNFIYKIEQLFYFSFFYAALVLIFYISLSTTSHILITIPFLSVYNAFTTEQGLFHSIYLAFSEGISAHESWTTFLEAISVVAAIVAATFCIRYLFESK